jgi:aminoglycoside 6'-N-acetyltransferase I
MIIRYASNCDSEAWLELRHALWPDGSRDEHRREIESFLAGTAREPQAVLIAEREDGHVVGFAELSIRPYAEGCTSDRVAFLEGWYVVPKARRRGVGKELVAAAECWAVAQGCTEFASDTQAENETSSTAHRHCGFIDVATIRCFRKELPNKAMHATCEDARA